MDRRIKSILAQNSLIVSRLDALEKLIAGGKIDIDHIADPSPDDGGYTGGFGGIIGGNGGIIDPAPIDLQRLSKVQLESRLADVKFARTKLDAVEGLLKEALSAAK